MPLPTARAKTVLLHLGVWLAYYFYEVGFIVLTGMKLPNQWDTSLNWALYALVVYGNALWLFPRFFVPRRYLAYVGALGAVLLAYIAIKFCLNAYLLPRIIDAKLVMPTDNLRMFLATSYFRVTTFLGYSMVYAYARHAIGLQKQLREQEHQLRLQERSLLEADIAFLKSQINPHFLFNALNFLYSQVYPLSEPTAKSVLLLSDIMRYALNEGGEQGKVMLEKEVQHLRNYLALNQLRFGNNLQVEFEVAGNTQYLMILPLVLITFVENCFKHGELFDARNPLLLRLTVRDNELELYTRNRKRTGPVEHSTGIGLDNTRRRLDAVYANRYRLAIADEPDSYTAHLHLSL
ncbi:histidine kinase [Hymenobacter sp. DH14]|uniref:Histidine kinase n=1 Tax=Hymenobacter cyanobacteriorum TaxID=2926463 RepID=A0A9X1VHJ2_9BACT|nr:histidine kinase [Hymenobacter cyanobacteriorum]MCI1187025.1 histidine kinase [Hymenobacter cyanobacteriorum]